MPNYTPLQANDPANETTFNAVFDEFDAAIGDLPSLPTTPKTSLAAALGSVPLPTTAQTVTGALAEVYNGLAGKKENQNVIFDPLNQYCLPTVTAYWSNGYSHWYQGTNLSIISPDASNPYSSLGKTLRVGTVSAYGGKYVWCHEAGIQPGDVVSFAAYGKAAAGQFRLEITFWNAASGAIGATENGDLYTYAGSAVVIKKENLTVPAGTVKISVVVRRFTGTDNYDIYAMWGGVGGTAGAIQQNESAAAWELSMARGVYDTLALRLDDLSTSQLVFDPLNITHAPRQEWNDLQHWYDPKYALEWIANDSSNPYGGHTLRFLNTSVWDPPGVQAGKKIYMSEAGLQPGERISFAASGMASAGDFRLEVYFYSAAGTLLSGPTGTITTFAGVAQTLTLLNQTIPANTFAIWILIKRQAGTADFDIYGIWARRGTTAGAPAPSAYPVVVPGKTYEEVSTTGLVHNVRNWPAVIARLQEGESVTPCLALLGDSWFELKGAADLIIERVQAMYGNAGHGFITFTPVNTTHMPDGVTMVRTGTWTDYEREADSRGPNIGHAASTDVATPAAIAVTATFQTAKLLYYKRTGGGDFRWKIDAGAWTTVSTDDANEGLGTVDIPGLSNASHTLTVEVTVAGSQGVILEGVDLRLTATGVVVHNVSKGSSTTTDWTDVAEDQWLDSLEALGVTSVVYVMGTNEFSTARATLLAKYGTLITRIRTRFPLADIVFCPSPHNGAFNHFQAEEYSRLVASIAAANSCAMYDMFKRFGPYSDANSRGLFDGSQNHLTAAGNRVWIGDLVRRFFDTGFVL